MNPLVTHNIFKNKIKYGILRNIRPKVKFEDLEIISVLNIFM